jgi:hypothetical protein
MADRAVGVGAGVLDVVNKLGRVCTQRSFLGLNLFEPRVRNMTSSGGEQALGRIPLKTGTDRFLRSCNWSMAIHPLDHRCIESCACDTDRTVRYRVELANRVVNTNASSMCPAL